MKECCEQILKEGVRDDIKGGVPVYIIYRKSFFVFFDFQFL